MPRVKGTAKTGGRVAGTPNRIQTPLRDKIKNFGEENFEEVIAAWNCITDPKDKVKAYIDIISFAIPKLQAVQMDANIQRQSSVEEDLKKLSEEG